MNEKTNDKKTVSNKKTVSGEKTVLSKKTVSGKKPFKKEVREDENGNKYIVGKRGGKMKLPHSERDNYKNVPLLKMNKDIEPGKNRTAMMINAEILAFEDIDLHDPKQVEQRLQEYFALYAKYDYKPTMAGLGVAMNCMSRATLSAIVNGGPVNGQGGTSALPKATTDLLKKAYRLLEMSWETYMNSGSINPASGIFLGKNQFGYKDVVEQVIRPDMPGDEVSVDDIKSRYLEPGKEEKLSKAKDVTTE